METNDVIYDVISAFHSNIWEHEGNTHKCSNHITFLLSTHAFFVSRKCITHTTYLYTQIYAYAHLHKHRPMS